MINYRLLRDNKESGPYSEEEMIAKGFKPYDLLWAEGKSAGWQYPSEIPAFKKFAPIVEEQPYDRFYKKQPPQKLFALEERNTNFSYQPQPQKSKETSQPKEAVPSQPAIAMPSYEYKLQDLPARHIHVTLPSGNTVNLTTLVTKKEDRELADNNQAADKKNNTAVKTEQKQSSFSEAVSVSMQSTMADSNPVTTVAADTRPAKMEATRQPVSLPVYQQARAAFSWSLLLGAVIGIATLVGLGIMIGLSMNREKNDLAFNEAIRSRAKQTSPVRPVNPGVTTNTSTVLPVVATEEPAGTQQRSTVSTKNHALVENAVVKAAAASDNANDNKKIAEPEKPAVEKNNVIPVQDNPVHHTKIAVDVVAIGKTLNITENDFKTGAFGGISNLKLTLENGSKSPLESVLVEVDYILTSKKVYKTEKLFFRDIPAGAQVTVDAPASSRGIKINTRIIKINARETTLSNTTAKS